MQWYEFILLIVACVVIGSFIGAIMRYTERK